MSAPASKPTAGQVGGWSIDPGNVELIDLNFNRLDFTKDASEDDSNPVDVQFEFSAVRVSEGKVAVALEVKVRAPATIEISVLAGTVLTVEHPDEPANVIDAELAKIAAQVGPVIIYPYARELVADLTRRSGKGTLTLPIYQVGSLFEVNPEEIRLPDAPKEPSKSAKKPSKKAAKEPLKTTSKKPKTAS